MRAYLGICSGLLLLASSAIAQEPAKAPDGSDPAIGEVGRAFVNAFNAGDSKTLAAMFTEGAEILEEGEEPIRGRAAIEASFQALFKESKGVQMAVKVDRIDTLDPNLAVEEGTVTITLPGDPEIVDISRDSVTYLRENGKWRIAGIRDLPAETKTVTPHDRLLELDWLTGEWVSESFEAVVRTSCKWDDGGNYLIRSYSVQIEGKPAMTGHQRIGWDPETKQIKSWVFDADGGHGEALWSRDGDRWVIKARGVRADGTLATATQVLTKIDNDHARWASADRTLGGVAVPDIDEFSLVRRPPTPK